MNNNNTTVPLFTKEQVDLFLPKLDAPVSLDEFLSTLSVINDGIDFGEVLDYNSTEEARLMNLAQAYCRK